MICLFAWSVGPRIQCKVSSSDTSLWNMIILLRVRGIKLRCLPRVLLGLLSCNVDRLAHEPFRTGGSKLCVCKDTGVLWPLWVVGLKKPCDCFWERSGVHLLPTWNSENGNRCHGKWNTAKPWGPWVSVVCGSCWSHSLLDLEVVPPWCWGSYVHLFSLLSSLTVDITWLLVQVERNSLIAQVRNSEISPKVALSLTMILLHTPLRDRLMVGI